MNTTTEQVLPIPSELLSEIVAKVDPSEWRAVSEALPVINWKQVVSMVTSNLEQLLLEAVKRGDDFVVRILLQFSSVDPTVNKDEPLLTASSRGYHKVVRVLLLDPRIDPSDLHNEAIKLACNAGRHEEIVALLSQDPRVKEAGWEEE